MALDYLTWPHLAWHTGSRMVAVQYKVVGEPTTDALGRVAIHIEASPPGAIVEVSWSPACAHAFAEYEAWDVSGVSELVVLRSAIEEASRYMREHPEKRSLCRSMS